MGVGNAFHGIVKLLCDRGKKFGAQLPSIADKHFLIADSVHQRVTGVIVFIADNPVRPVHSNENPWLSKWYSQNSSVFVANTHSLWSKTDRKMSRRYGKVERSPGTMLNEMLIMHRDEVFEWVAQKTGLDRIKSQEGLKVAEDLVMSLERPESQRGLGRDGKY
jgi:histone deacetylase 6